MESFQQQQLFRVLLSIIYQTNLSKEQWLIRVSTALSTFLPLDHGMSVIGYLTQVDPGDVVQAVAWGAPAGLELKSFSDVFPSYQKNISSQVQFGMHGGILCGYTSSFPLSFFRGEHELMLRNSPGKETKDAFGINGLNPGGQGVCFAAFVSPQASHQVSASDYMFIRELSYHLAVASYLVCRSKDMTIPEAFSKLQQETKQGLVLSISSPAQSGAFALEELAFAYDQAEQTPSRLLDVDVKKMYQQLQQGQLILRHQFDRANAHYFIVQKALPILVPKEAFSREESVLFHHFALTESVKQAVDFLPGGGRSIQRGYQLMKQIAWKLGMPQAKPEELLPLAKVWLVSKTEQSFDGLFKDKTQKTIKFPPGLRGTVFSLAGELCYVLRWLEPKASKNKKQNPRMDLPRSALPLLVSTAAGKSVEELSFEHKLAASTVKRRLATARRFGMI